MKKSWRGMRAFFSEDKPAVTTYLYGDTRGNFDAK